MTTLTPTFTAVGNAAIAAANGLGIQVQIAEVGIGTGAYDPTGDETALQAEISRAAVVAGGPAGERAVNVRAAVPNVASGVSVAEIGFFDPNGVLIAVWSRSTGPLFIGDGELDLLLDLTLSWDHAPDGIITVQITDLTAQALIDWVYARYPMIMTPSLISPASLTDLPTSPAFVFSAYESLYDREHVATHVQIASNSDFSSENLLVDDTFLQPLTGYMVEGGTLSEATSYYLRVSYENSAGDLSAWSDAIGFTTGSVLLAAPTITAPVEGAIVWLNQQPSVTLSDFVVTGGSDTHLATEIEIATDAAFSAIIWTSGTLGAVTGVQIPVSALTTDTAYFIRARYRGAALGWSAWSAVIGVTTASSFTHIAPPVITSLADGATVPLTLAVVLSDFLVIGGGADTLAESRVYVYADAGLATLLDTVTSPSTTLSITLAAVDTDYWLVPAQIGTSLAESLGAAIQVRTSAVASVADVFDTALYTGTGASQNITTGLDLLNEGGLVWIKNRGAGNHHLFDTVRGANVSHSTNQAVVQSTIADSLTGFGADGFWVGSAVETNDTDADFVAWSFRNAPKFFDVVSYTGNSGSQSIPHNLGVTPGLMIVHQVTNDHAGWFVWHKALAGDEYLTLNSNSDKTASWNGWSGTLPTSSNFSLGPVSEVNDTGDDYIAYLFADDPDPAGDIICDSFTADASGIGAVEIGWEPQWLLIKSITWPGNWRIIDVARGETAQGWSVLVPDDPSGEGSWNSNLTMTATGITLSGLVTNTEYLVLAIRKAV